MPIFKKNKEKKRFFDDTKLFIDDKMSEQQANKTCGMIEGYLGKKNLKLAQF